MSETVTLNSPNYLIPSSKTDNCSYCSICGETLYHYNGYKGFQDTDIGPLCWGCYEKLEVE